MPTVTVLGQGRPRVIPFDPGLSLREILDTTDLRVRSGCRGNGACGLCRIRIEEGALPEPTRNERLHLTGEELRGGIRLACQAIPRQELRIYIVNPAPSSNWTRPAAADHFLPSSLPRRMDGPRREGGPSLGVAVDLGTTHVSATLWDLEAGKRLTGRLGQNRQLQVGADVITRIVAASESGEHAERISRLAVDSIGEALYDISAREGFDLRQVTRVSIVGNTAQLALLAGKNHGLLMQPKFWESGIDCRPEGTRSWCSAWNIDPEAMVEVIPPLAGFVGSDLLAGVLATGMTALPGISLLIDFGTNSEMALWDGSTLWVTSAAGGPAFEGSGPGCGMPAEAGAIYRIDQEGNSRNLAFHVLAGAEPKGLCGSGLVDLIASLLRAGLLNAKGKFNPEAADHGFSLPGEGRDLLLRSRDVDLFQRAKGAIGAGICVLLRTAGLTTGEVERLFVSGAFGRFVNVANAQRIGLLPRIEEGAVELCGNTALAGCELLLTAPGRLAELESIRGRARIINLSQREDFEALFMENLYLNPMETL